mmetsp:Transcript_12847/g.26634  ORF Transcript_12847/g.26634 Transcript_12847/m.26634 type:complete len:85 (-) Transcript_12847:73-327(-)
MRALGVSTTHGIVDPRRPCSGIVRPDITVWLGRERVVEFVTPKKTRRLATATTITMDGSEQPSEGKDETVDYSTLLNHSDFSFT